MSQDAAYTNKDELTIRTVSISPWTRVTSLCLDNAI